MTNDRLLVEIVAGVPLPQGTMSQQIVRIVLARGEVRQVICTCDFDDAVERCVLTHRSHLPHPFVDAAETVRVHLESLHLPVPPLGRIVALISSEMNKLDRILL